ncbi:MAG: DUF4114 domain-containing protein [Pseudomonadota bacterium]
MAEIQKSTYLDFTSGGTLTSTGQSVSDAYDVISSRIVTDPSLTVTVGIVLDRANDPTDLLNMDWGTRQATLARMEADGTLWSTYGTSASTFALVSNTLTGMGIPIVGEETGHVTSAAARTIWVEVDGAQFKALFGTDLRLGTSASAGEFYYWDGNLQVPDAISPYVTGVWPDLEAGPATETLNTSTVTLAEGAQSPGNATSARTDLFPQDIAALYNFPDLPADLDTGTLALIEPATGDYVTKIAEYGTFQQRLNAYRATAGVGGVGEYYVVNRDNQSSDGDDGERSLDVGVVSAVVPNSRIGLYVGSGNSTYSTYQTAIWDLTNNPSVISSSFSDLNLFTKGSPFETAYRELFIDAALRGISVFNDAYDGGSGNETGTGLTNLFVGSMSPYAMVVGGTSLSTGNAADNDATLADTVTAATAGDLQTIWQLVRGGLRQWSDSLSDNATFIETVWNEYYLENGTMKNNYLSNNTTSGGVDTTQVTPQYQTAYGLTPTDADPNGGVGRGAPDVAANAGGNLFYSVPDSNMVGVSESGGTSAATPLWASLATRLNAIFADQGLPDLGYSNDLYYIASAISPASFNDITVGNNTSTYINGNGFFAEKDGTYYALSATGIGYEAGEGYDLVSGLGTPNGVLLGRALTTIAHSQLYYDLAPVLETGTDGWESDATQSLIFQTTFGQDASWSLTLDGAQQSFAGSATGAYAWTAALAQQSLQSDFSTSLVTMFDGYAQGQAYQTTLAGGTDLAIAVAGQGASAYQSTLTGDFGFMDFMTGAGASVEVARAVATATTAGGADDMGVVVRLRQNGMNGASVMFYEVDDYAGSISGLAPGDAGYAAAAEARAYQTSAGGNALSGAGYGGYSEGMILNVDSGDLIAMQLTSNGNTFWAFAPANEEVNGQDVAHLWSYGLNTWGWEDLYGGGDRDFNDLIVQLDFTSAAGSGLLL